MDVCGPDDAIRVREPYPVVVPIVVADKIAFVSVVRELLTLCSGLGCDVGVCSGPEDPESIETRVVMSLHGGHEERVGGCAIWVDESRRSVDHVSCGVERLGPEFLGEMRVDEHGSASLSDKTIGLFCYSILLVMVRSRRSELASVRGQEILKLGDHELGSVVELEFLNGRVELVLGCLEKILNRSEGAVLACERVVPAIPGEVVSDDDEVVFVTNADRRDSPNEIDVYLGKRVTRSFVRYATDLSSRFG